MRRQFPAELSHKFLKFLRKSLIRDSTHKGGVKLCLRRLGMKSVTPLGALIGIGILGALLTALAVWLVGGPIWAIVLGYILGGMIYMVLGGIWLARIRNPPKD